MDHFPHAKENIRVLCSRSYAQKYSTTSCALSDDPSFPHALESNPERAHRCAKHFAFVEDLAG